MLFALAYVSLDGAYGYFVQRKNENGLRGNIVRVELNAFQPSSVKVLNLEAIDARLVGFTSAFTCNANVR